VAISRIMGGRGVAVLPEGMSQERFDWLAAWVSDAADIIRTPGTESNVKEIYDACAELAEDPRNVVLNQFCEFANHLAHLQITGCALERVVESLVAATPRLRPAAFVAATGSAGTLAAGDWLKERVGTRTVAVEPLECPTMLYNGYGEHNIQGIGDKHIPLIHNVTNTDMVIAVSDRATDDLGVLCASDTGLQYLAKSGTDPDVLGALRSFGLSSLCNIVACVKTARTLGLGPDDVILTVATDGADLYRTEHDRVELKRFGGQFGRADAEAVHREHLRDVGTEHVLTLDEHDRDRIFNLGYFTWVEQQNVPLPVFDSRRDQSFWCGLRELLPKWDEMITDLNARVAAPS
jgi:cysteine synthase